jgi:PAS domain S-box-containing protein
MITNITGVIVIGCDITEQKRAEEKLRESEEKYRSMMEAMVEPAYICTSDFIVSYMNPAMVKRTGRDATGELCYKAINDLDEQCPWCVHDKIQNGENDETIIVSPKDRRLYSISRAPIFHNDSSISKMTIYRDITEIKQTEQKLKEREKELEIKNIRLEEINTAMKILLKKREEDKIEIEDNVLTNVKELLEPYFEKIKKTKLNDQQEAFLTIIESNLNEIISPFTRKMSLKYLNLTPAEIRIANLIRHGIPSKEIAELLNLSPRTVETHRKNIRRKIGLEGKRANLRSHLLSLH